MTPEENSIDLNPDCTMSLREQDFKNTLFTNLYRIGRETSPDLSEEQKPGKKAQSIKS